MKNKTHFYNVAIIILTTAVVVMFAKYNSLKSYVSLLENSLSNETTRLEQQIGAIYHNVDEQLNRQASLLTSVTHEFLDLDADTKKANVKFSIVPKTIMTDMTVNITLGENTVEMTKENNGQYSAVLPVNIFEKEDMFPLITLNSNGEAKTEYLEEHSMLYIWTEYLPTIRGKINPDKAGLKGENLIVEGQLEVGTSIATNGENIEFTKYNLKVEVDGKEISNKDITNLVQNDEIDVPFNEEYNIGNGKVLVICIEAEDSLGFKHEKMAFSWNRPSSDGMVGAAQMEAVAVRYAGETIYDKDGTVLFNKMDF